MDLPVEINPELIEYIKQTYELQWNGLHGWGHWVRVYENGMYIAERNGADRLVVALFAFTHDMARRNDHLDPFHGWRAAKRIKKELQDKYFKLNPTQLKWLTQAVKEHTDGHIRADLTVMTCWDSDRLDLGRAGIRPSASRLCTQEARDPATIAWAYERSLGMTEGAGKAFPA